MHRPARGQRGVVLVRWCALGAWARFFIQSARCLYGAELRSEEVLQRSFGSAARVPLNPLVITRIVKQFLAKLYDDDDDMPGVPAGDGIFDEMPGLVQEPAGDESDDELPALALDDFVADDGDDEMPALEPLWYR